jgi:CheY-like chemotaxis protein
MNAILSTEAQSDGTRTATILVAEDHADSRDALQALLEAFGYDVVLAANGREALDLAVARCPDLILMDIMMPEMDGFEATRRIRGDARTRRVPIIAVTAMEGASPLAIAAGADDCVRKPVEIRGLLKKMQDWLPGP